MDHIGSLFEKVKQRVQKRRLKPLTVQKILLKKIGINISLDSIRIQGDVVYIKNINPTERNEIMFQKNIILKYFQEEELNIVDIR